MKISFIPRYTRHAASSRLRCYALAEAMSRHGLARVQVGYSIHDSCDVIVAQKLDCVPLSDVHAHRNGARLVYDIDDEMLSHAGKNTVAHCADIVTTDTELRAQGIREWFRGPVHVIPDPIDYEDGPPKPPNPDAHDGVVWFGNWPNFASIREIMALYARAGERIGAISDLTPDRANCPGLELIPWRLETFTTELRKWSHCALSHAGADQCKSENKMVAAIYQGVFPAYVCGPAYEALVAKLVGLSDAAAQQFIYETYRAEVIARRALEVYAG